MNCVSSDSNQIAQRLEPNRARNSKLRSRRRPAHWRFCANHYGTFLLENKIGRARANKRPTLESAFIPIGVSPTLPFAFCEGWWLLCLMPEQPTQIPRHPNN